MQLIVDANVLLSAFLKKAVTREFRLDVRLDLAAPEYLLSETLRHLQNTTAIRKRINLSADQIQTLFLLLTQRIQVFSKNTYKPFMEEALMLAPHREDAPYLALSLLLKAAVWSNDKRLKGQGVVVVSSTHELFVILQKMSG